MNTSGNFSGTVASFDAADMSLGLLQNSIIKGNASINGLPDVENTFMDFQLDRFQTDAADLSAFIEEDLPENISTLGLMQYKGEVTGFIRDFVSYGVMRTNLGNIDSDVNLKFNEDYSDATYKGRLVTRQFDLGRFYEMNSLGKVTFHMDIKGEGIERDNFNVDIEGKLDSIYFNGYNYTKVSLAGDFSPLLFKGDASVNDPNLKMAFQGNIDFNSEIPIMNFVVQADSANLRKLNIDSTSDFFAASAIRRQPETSQPSGFAI